MKKEEKTNVMRVLDGKKITYQSHAYTPDATMTGEEIAGILGEDPACVFKTLVTQGKSGAYYVCVVPVKEELDLKKAARQFGVKKIEMLPMKRLLPLTGYVHGGCSPIGMKKSFPTAVDETAQLFDHIYVSGGRIGLQLRLSPDDLIEVTDGFYGDLTT